MGSTRRIRPAKRESVTLNSIGLNRGDQTRKQYGGLCVPRPSENFPLKSVSVDAMASRPYPTPSLSAGQSTSATFACGTIATAASTTKPAMLPARIGGNLTVVFCALATAAIRTTNPTFATVAAPLTR
jgi:hypothetical protein